MKTSKLLISLLLVAGCVGNSFASTGNQGYKCADEAKSSAINVKMISLLKSNSISNREYILTFLKSASKSALLSEQYAKEDDKQETAYAKSGYADLSLISKNDYVSMACKEKDHANDMLKASINLALTSQGLAVNEKNTNELIRLIK